MCASRKWETGEKIYSQVEGRALQTLKHREDSCSLKKYFSNVNWYQLDYEYQKNRKRDHHI